MRPYIHQSPSFLGISQVGLKTLSTNFFPEVLRKHPNFHIQARNIKSNKIECCYGPVTMTVVRLWKWLVPFVWICLCRSVVPFLDALASLAFKLSLSKWVNKLLIRLQIFSYYNYYSQFNMFSLFILFSQFMNSVRDISQFQSLR